MTQSHTFIKLLKKFNRKERFLLIGWTLGNPRFRASKTFLKSISPLIGTEIPSDAFVAMDYHLTWLYASVFLSSAKAGTTGPYSNKQKLITGTQEDVDLLIAFRRGRTHRVVMLEAKGATGWTNKQARSKASRLTKIFGRDGKRWPSIKPHFVLASPREPQQLDLKVWPGWMKRPDGSPYWVEMPMPKGLVKTMRCDSGSHSDADGEFWTVPGLKQALQE